VVICGEFTFSGVVFALQEGFLFVFLLQQIREFVAQISQNTLLLCNKWHTMQICPGELFKK
jgi:hypothetical protein